MITRICVRVCVCVRARVRARTHTDIKIYKKLLRARVWYVLKHCKKIDN